MKKEKRLGLEGMKNLDTIKLERFLTEIQHLLAVEINGIGAEELKVKFVELFEKSGPDDEISSFQKRLEKTYDLFNKWLEREKGVDMNKAALFCMPILKVIIKKSIKDKKQGDEVGHYGVTELRSR